MPTSRNGHAYRPNPPRRLVGPPSWLAPDHVADPGKMVLDRFAGSGEPIPPPPSPWLVARQAAAACPDRRGPSCGCEGWECVRGGKAGPTDLSRCAGCLGIELPGAIQTG